MNILSKSYQGPFYWVALVLSSIATVLTSPQIVDLGWPWAGPIALFATNIALLAQQLTPIGDPK